jgi:hypothetical protein
MDKFATIQTFHDFALYPDLHVQVVQQFTFHSVVGNEIYLFFASVNRDTDNPTFFIPLARYDESFERIPPDGFLFLHLVDLLFSTPVGIKSFSLDNITITVPNLYPIDIYTYTNIAKYEHEFMIQVK